MIIKYKFLSTLADEVTEVEVNDELGKLIEQVGADEHNLERDETRRHIYLSELEEKGRYIADDYNLLEDILEDEFHKALMTAIEKLQPQQKEQLILIYWKSELQKDIAAEEGVSEMAISNGLKRIIQKIKKLLE